MSCALLLLALQAKPQASGDQIYSMEMHGTIGPYHVSLNYTVRNQTELVAAHYFYISQLKDIPLTGVARDQRVEWKGADGSVFHLHFFGNGSQGTEPLTFYNSIGLSGTWVLGSRTLPVKFTGGYGTANPGERLYSDVTTAPDRVFEEMVRNAKQAILSGDRSALAHYVHFPLQVNAGRKHIRVHNPAELNADWSTIFTPGMLSKTRTYSPHEMFVHEGEAMLGDGELWFDDKGLASINVF